MIRRVVAVLCALAVGAVAAEARPFKAKDLVGTWAYVAAYTERPDGTRTDEFGAAPAGRFLIGSDGQYVHVVMRPDLPRVSSGQRGVMTDAEAQAIAKGVLAHFGTWTADERGGTFTAEIADPGSSYPNFDGIAQVRTVLELTRTTLRYSNPVSSTCQGCVVFAELRRVVRRGRSPR